MNKQQAIELLGGNVTAAAKAIGISYQAVNKWPDSLPPRISDRVVAAALRIGKKQPKFKSKAENANVNVLIQPAMDANT